MARTLSHTDVRAYPVAGDWHTVAELATNLKIGRPWVEAQLAEMPYQPEWRQYRKSHRNAIYLHYPPMCLEELQALAQAWLSRPALGAYHTIRQAADKLGCSDKWVLRAIKQHGLQAPELRRASGSRLALAITPATLRQLRALQLPLPPPGARNITQLWLETGWAKKKIVRSLSRAGYEPTLCRSPEAGRPVYYYPAEATRILGTKPSCLPQGGDWLTSGKIEQSLHRGHNWVQSKLADPAITTAAEQRLDDNGAIRQHYPPWVFQKLKAESEAPHSTHGGE